MLRNKSNLKSKIKTQVLLFISKLFVLTWGGVYGFSVDFQGAGAFEVFCEDEERCWRMIYSTSVRGGKHNQTRRYCG